MLKLNRTTEYGLIALRHISRKGSDATEAGVESQTVTSAREIADQYGLPFEILAKTLQRLKDTGLISSAQGARGGYTLKRSLSDVNLAEFLMLMEGPQSVVACVSHSGSETAPGGQVSTGCAYNSKCEIQHMMNGLNARLMQFLAGITLSEIAANATISKKATKDMQEAIPVPERGEI